MKLNPVKVQLAKLIHYIATMMGAATLGLASPELGWPVWAAGICFTIAGLLYFGPELILLRYDRFIHAKRKSNNQYCYCSWEKRFTDIIEPNYTENGQRGWLVHKEAAPIYLCDYDLLRFLDVLPILDRLEGVANLTVTDGKTCAKCPRTATRLVSYSKGRLRLIGQPRGNQGTSPSGTDSLPVAAAPEGR